MMRLVFEIVADFPSDTTPEQIRSILAAAVVQVAEPNIFDETVPEDAFDGYTIHVENVRSHWTQVNA